MKGKVTNDSSTYGVAQDLLILESMFIGTVSELK